MSNKSESNLDAHLSKTALDETPPPPFSSRISVDFFGMSEKGRDRTNNEDHFLLVRIGRAVETVLTNLSEAETLPGELFEESGYGMVLADGGDAAGGVASRQAICTLLSLALHTPDWQFRWGARERNTVLWRMKDRFRRINAALLRNAATSPGVSGMGTTMTAAVIHGNGLIIAHLGDSRAYILDHGKLIQLTHDHTLGARQVEDGTQAASDPLVTEPGGPLLKVLGSESECEPEVYHRLLENNDQLLLCSDGLTDMVGDSEIETIMNSANCAKSACHDLVDRALSNGGRDNVTVIVARYSVPG
jgi:PPM family protein phosphatase